MLRKTIEVGIVDNDVYEDDEQFFVQLSNVKAIIANNQTQQVTAKLGDAAVATVLVVDDDHGGAFSFTSEVFRVAENAGKLRLEVILATKSAKVCTIRRYCGRKSTPNSANARNRRFMNGDVY